VFVVVGFLAGGCVAIAPSFNIASGTVKCFIEEVPRDTAILADWQLAPVGGSPTDVGLRCWVMDPEGTTVRESGGALVAGTLMHVAQAGGEHRVCFMTNTSRWFSGSDLWRATVDMRTGVSTIDYAQLAKAEHLNALELLVRKSNDRITQIRNEQGYQRARELAFRATSESTNTRVLIMACLQLVVLVACAVWQVYHLRTYFRKKKFV
jgi:hypothetical protein